jgi:flavin-dependent dehydrogenase
MRDAFDCVVIGGGPAGSTAAAIVAEAGFATLLVERGKMPRFHVGESLMPETFWTLQRLGLLDNLRSSPFVRKVGVQFVSKSGTESQPFYFDQHDPRECSQTWHVERADFDLMLFENAAARGAECHDATRALDVQLADQPPHRVRLRNEAGEMYDVSARVVIDATGQQAFLANRLGLREPNPRLRKAAIWGHFRNAKRNSDGEAEVTTILHGRVRGIWFWYIPLADNKVSVGLVGDNDDLLKRGDSPDKVFCDEAAACPGVSDRIRDAQLVDQLYIAKEFSYTTKQQAGDGWVLIGDASGFIDPIYSTGVLLALRSGELAADAVVSGLRANDLSAEQLAGWMAAFDEGVSRFRSLVNAFYHPDFSFARFIKQHPQHQGRLTDLLIGRGFSTMTDDLLADLRQAVPLD